MESFFLSKKKKQISKQKKLKLLNDIVLINSNKNHKLEYFWRQKKGDQNECNFIFIFIFLKKSYFGSGILPIRRRNHSIEFLVMLPPLLGRGGDGRRWRSSRTRIRGVARAGCSQWVHSRLNINSRPTGTLSSDRFMLPIYSDLI